MFKILKSKTFDLWLTSLRDREAAMRINARIIRAEGGNFGEKESVGSGIFEMKLTYGPGYRIYYKQVGDKVYFILCGGDKSTQSKDIEQAKQIALLIK